ncbi:co-chaperone DjlA [Gilvimarinus sp. F26214L]|uniref:co-chaperone DjlA n=1 Tax=Gilvimarinus sp. DZF01 TaxID=3461371 RepID=UPI0040462B91
MIIGKVVGALLGYQIGGWWLAIVGLIVGHIFDRGYAMARRGVGPEQLHHIQQVFFRSVFTLLGHLAKADGRISEAEVKQTEHFMAQMGLTAEHRREAIRLFKEGAEPGFDAQAQMLEFRQVCGRHHNLVQLLLVYLVNVALADGRVDDNEERVLRQVAEALGISRLAFEQLLRMIRAQNAFGEGQAAPADSLKLAYEALGIDENASDAQVKRAYRKLMSEYHPDKLMGQGVPDDMVQAATERSQEIQKAYDTIKKARGK